ncbi:molybdopterin-guanine dinucleotide biosynthesis protein B [Celerinatantimonas sp. YJH-8]|uniref:molybdopterin-guanine dinucleotide biosynthesis protein B n=1 Tax=Celerinatantimonas sp. YJH-8 TaxID=3228714 RepID=UPI0038CB1597
MIEPHEQNWPKPVIGLAGYSGAGKTTLLCQLVEIITAKGFNVAVIKHSHHQIELDKPGKDSYRIKHSGARQLLLSCPNQVILFAQQRNHDSVESQLARLQWSEIDLVLVEGYRHSAIPKFEIHRPALQKPLLADQDPHIFAIATNEPLSPQSLPIWPLDDAEYIAEQLLQHL